MRLQLASAIVGMLLCLLIRAGHAQVVAPLSEVKVTVVDETGAVIPNSDVAFKSDSNTIVSSTGPNGSVTVTLPSGRYTITADHLGFVKTIERAFQVAALKPNELRIVLKVDFHPYAAPCCSMVPETPTTTSDLPNFIPLVPEPDPAPSAEAVLMKTRSWHCLYLRKCSISYVRVWQRPVSVTSLSPETSQ